MAYYSRNGKAYDDAFDVIMADIAWDKERAEQKKQNDLIAKQNELIRQQIEESRELEYEKMNKQLEMQEKQMEHDKEMRILKLFDNIGISKKTFDKYVYKTIFNEKWSEISEKIHNYSEEIRKYKILLEYVKDENIDDISEDSELYKLNKKLSSNLYEVDKTEQKKLKNELKEIEENNKNYKIYTAWAVGLSFFISSLGVAADSETFIGLYVIPVLILGIALIIFASRRSRVNEIKYLLNKTELNYDKYKDKIILLIKETENKIIIEFKNSSLAIEKPINDLNEFRFNHYNKDVEKLLIDIEFDETIKNLGLDYPIITNENKINDGTIDDYITFFNNYKIK